MVFSEQCHTPRFTFASILALQYLFMKYNNRLAGIIAAGFIILLIGTFSSCKKKNTDDGVVPPIDSTTQVLGYGILNKLPGIWSGGVSSTTSLGGFSNWTLDFRRNSASQVSG